MVLPIGGQKTLIQESDTGLLFFKGMMNKI